MADVLPEAHELVDAGSLSAEDFRDFVFGNAVRLWGSADPDFFKGTVIEKQAAEYLQAVAPVGVEAVASESSCRRGLESKARWLVVNLVDYEGSLRGQ